MPAVAQHRHNRVARPQPPRRLDRPHTVHGRAAAHTQPLIAQQVLCLQGEGQQAGPWAPGACCAGRRDRDCRGCVLAGSGTAAIAGNNPLHVKCLQAGGPRWPVDSRSVATRMHGGGTTCSVRSAGDTVCCVRSTHHLHCLSVAALKGLVHLGPLKVAGQPVDADALCSIRQTGRQAGEGGGGWWVAGGGWGAHPRHSGQEWDARLACQAADGDGTSSQQASRLPSRNNASTHHNHTSTHQ